MVRVEVAVLVISWSVVEGDWARTVVVVRRMRREGDVRCIFLFCFLLFWLGVEDLRDRVCG